VNDIIPEKSYIESDLILVHKPVGVSSFDVIRKLRRILNIKKMGHAGTLDPLAQGLMIIGIQTGTKKMEQYLKLSKTYIADILIGISTTTADMEGEVLEKKQVLLEDISKRTVEDALLSLRGEQELMVPMYSAISVDGKRLYEYARKFMCPIEIPVKKMNVESVSMLDVYQQGNQVMVRALFKVSSGTYIRTLAEELGKKLALPAVLASLHRTQIAEFKDEDAFRYE